MKMKNLLVVFLLLGICADAYAHTRENLLIKKLAAVTNESTSSSVYQGFTRLYFHPGAWGNTSCRASAADIAPEDERVYKAALEAHIAGHKVDVKIDSRTRYETDVCKVEFIRVHAN